MKDKKYLKWYILFSILSFACMFGPIIVFGAMAYAGGALVTYKLALGGTLVVALILTAVNLMTKHCPRSKIWVILIGLHLCLNNFLPIVLTIAITQLADELVMTPLKHFFKKKYHNKED